MRRGLVLLCVCGLLTAPLRAATVTAIWDPNPDPPLNGAGLTNAYRVEWGTAPGVYTNIRDVGLQTMTVITDLLPGTTYYFAVSAWSVDQQFARSAEVAHTLTGQDPCAYPLGSAAVSIFPTAKQNTGSGGPGSKMRVDFQVGSSLPIFRVALRANGADLSVMKGDDLSALAGMWAVVPRLPPATYPISINAVNTIGCVREQLTTFAITIP
jgi:hypothetical protein